MFALRTVEGSSWRVAIPFGVRVLAHGVADRIDFFPALSPFVRVALLRAHVHDLELVAPLLRVLPLVFQAVSFDCPFSRAFPLHDTASEVRCLYYDELAAAAEKRCSSIDSVKCWDDG